MEKVVKVTRFGEEWIGSPDKVSSSTGGSGGSKVELCYEEVETIRMGINIEDRLSLVNLMEWAKLQWEVV
ncbi:hypothetical protein U2084_15045, partial [Listeria monocytogenes]|uniref:hypothetical protein n=1 Tax=Listeria monocytogenes TaxID=1639 RepID=UPI002FDBFD22